MARSQAGRGQAARGLRREGGTCPAAPPASARRGAECCRAVPPPHLQHQGHSPDHPSRALRPWARSAPQRITSLWLDQPDGGRRGSRCSAGHIPCSAARGVSARSQTPSPLPGEERAESCGAARSQRQPCRRPCLRCGASAVSRADATRSRSQFPAARSPCAIRISSRSSVAGAMPFSTGHHGPVERLVDPHGTRAEGCGRTCAEWRLLQQDGRDRRSRQSEGLRESRGSAAAHTRVPGLLHVSVHRGSGTAVTDGGWGGSAGAALWGSPGHPRCPRSSRCPVSRSSCRSRSPRPRVPTPTATQPRPPRRRSRPRPGALAAGRSRPCWRRGARCGGAACPRGPGRCGCAPPRAPWTCGATR